MKNTIWVTAGLLLLAVLLAASIEFYARTRAPIEMVRRMVVDFSDGARFDEKALTDFGESERQSAIARGREVQARLEDGSLTSTDLAALIDLIKEAYDDARLSLRELRALARQMETLAKR